VREIPVGTDQLAHIGKQLLLRLMGAIDAVHELSPEIGVRCASDLLLRCRVENDSPDRSFGQATMQGRQIGREGRDMMLILAAIEADLRR
jgi:hypothetical protein